MKLVFLRHGQAEHNLPSWQGGTNNYQSKLTPAGQKAAQEAAQQLKQFEFVAAYASPMLRTQQTAQMVLAQQKKPPKLQTDKRLADVYITGGLNRHRRRWQNFWRLRLLAHSQPKRGEILAKHKLIEGQRLGETITPIAEFLAEVKKKHQAGTVLIVAHLHTFWGISSQIEGDLTGILKSKNFLEPANWREMEA